MFSYHELEPSAQETFLDICSFFYDWKWDEVECIVGEEDMKCLEEGALIKRTEIIEIDNKKVIRSSISIHDLLLRIGRIKSKGNRFRTADEFNTALQNDKLLPPQVKGVWLKRSERPFHISSEVLDAMSGSLRVFAIFAKGNLTTVEGKCSKSFDKLRFIQAGEGCLSLILEAVIFKVFDNNGLLINTQNVPFYTSSLQPYTPLVLIIDCSIYSVSSETWKLLGRNLQWLETNSKLAFQIIYVGRHCNALTSVLLLGDRIMAYTPLTSLLEKFLSTFSDIYDYIGVFRSSADGLGEDGFKCLSAWEDISYVLNEVTFLTRTPRENNIELLRSLLVTGETDFLLLHNNQQGKLKVDDLKGKVVLLLITYCPISQGLFSVLEDVYAKMRGSQVEVVCIPKPRSSTTCDDYERAVSSFPWPVVPSPWSISEWEVQNLISHDGHRSYILNNNIVVVVDEAGKISCKDALPNILRWGVEAYPFSNTRQEELIKTEWEGLKFNSQSSLEFVFQNVELVQLWGKEAISRGEIILVCVGPPSQMFDFASELNFALAKLEIFVVCWDRWLQV